MSSRHELGNELFDRIFNYFERMGVPERYEEFLRVLNSVPRGRSRLESGFALGREADLDGHTLTLGMVLLEKREVNGVVTQVFISSGKTFELTVHPDGAKRLTLIQ